MQRYQFVSADSILAKFHRDFRGLDIHETDAIEWIGEALGFIKMVQASEEAVAFTEVRNYEADLPKGLHFITQIVRDIHWSPETKEDCTLEVVAETIEETQSCDTGWLKNAVPIDCDGRIIGDFEVAHYRPFFDITYPFGKWADVTRRHTRYAPVRLANHSFFNTLVCTEVDAEGLYNSCDYEYTIAQSKLRFSFKEGFAIVAYTRQMIDLETGYPMIPDDESARAAVGYYLGWKLKEREGWMHREGAMPLAKEAERLWLKYRKQFVNKTKMPYGPDQYQNLADGGKYLIPNDKKYFGYFGRIGKAEKRPFTDPNGSSSNLSTFRGR